MQILQAFVPRLEQIQRLADAIENRTADLQEAAALDAGFPVKVTALEIRLAADHLRTMAEEIPGVANKAPYGTVAAIFPYDAPTVMLARLGGAALLTNNRLRFSFSSHTPRSAAIIADIAEAFAPFEAVTRLDNREFGRRCVEDRAVRVQFVSGASPVGQVYREQAEAFDKVFFAGPGGMPAAVVFADADPVPAARFIAARAFVNGGQYCTTIKKALIHSDLFPAVRELVTAQTARLQIGDPLDAATDIGPIKVERTRRIVQNALARMPRARVVSGGIDGEWVYPLVLESEPGPIPDLEPFGPLLVLQPFSDPSSAVEQLVGTRYGFLLAFFGTPPAGARERFHAHFGMVHEHPDFFFTPMRLPFGGKKESGWILERNREGWSERDGAFIYSRELVRRG